MSLAGRSKGGAVKRFGFSLRGIRLFFAVFFLNSSVGRSLFGHHANTTGRASREVLRSCLFQSDIPANYFVFLCLLQALNFFFV